MKIRQLNNPPYLQVAIDNPNVEEMVEVLLSLPNSNRIIIEAGTPLIKQNGINIIKKIKGMIPTNVFIVADMKTLDTGALEVQIAANAGADAIVVSGLAPDQTINNVISEARERGIYSIIDTLNLPEPIRMLERLKTLPDVVELHRAIDAEVNLYNWGFIPTMKSLSEKSSAEMLIAVAGGVQIDNINDALAFGADILVAGRAITNAKDVYQTAEMFIEGLDKYKG